MKKIKTATKTLSAEQRKEVREDIDRSIERYRNVRTPVGQSMYNCLVALKAARA